MTKIQETQLPCDLISIIDDQLEIFERKRSITQQNTIPGTSNIPLDNPNHWLKIPDVICVYVDMKGSTKLSASERDNATAGAYQLFVASAVRLFNAFEASYIDISGDAVFALFNSDQPYRALAAAVSFKTFSDLDFRPQIEKITDTDIGTHMGIDQKTVLVKRLGMRDSHQTQRENEVWAGKPVNMAAKLASLSKHGELLISDRYFNNIQNELSLLTCGCPDGTKLEIWTEKDLSDTNTFDFNTAYSMTTKWCGIHGKQFCNNILKLDD
jgi:class 3 adenylate cyclase